MCRRCPYLIQLRVLFQGVIRLNHLCLRHQPLRTHNYGALPIEHSGKSDKVCRPNRVRMPSLNGDSELLPRRVTRAAPLSPCLRLLPLLCVPHKLAYQQASFCQFPADCLDSLHIPNYLPRRRVVFCIWRQCTNLYREVSLPTLKADTPPPLCGNLVYRCCLLHIGPCESFIDLYQVIQQQQRTISSFLKSHTHHFSCSSPLCQPLTCSVPLLSDPLMRPSVCI